MTCRRTPTSPGFQPFHETTAFRRWSFIYDDLPVSKPEPDMYVAGYFALLRCAQNLGAAGYKIVMQTVEDSLTGFEASLRAAYALRDAGYRDVVDALGVPLNTETHDGMCHMAGPCHGTLKSKVFETEYMGNPNFAAAFTAKIFSENILVA